MNASLPVKGRNGRWLAPCSAARARMLMREGKADLRVDDRGGRYLQMRAVAAASAPEGVPA